MRVELVKGLLTLDFGSDLFWYRRDDGGHRLSLWSDHCVCIVGHLYMDMSNTRWLGLLDVLNSVRLSKYSRETQSSGVHRPANLIARDLDEAKETLEQRAIQAIDWTRWLSESADFESKRPIEGFRYWPFPLKTAYLEKAAQSPSGVYLVYQDKPVQTFKIVENLGDLLRRPKLEADIAFVKMLQAFYLRTGDDWTHLGSVDDETEEIKTPSLMDLRLLRAGRRIRRINYVEGMTQ